MLTNFFGIFTFSIFQRCKFESSRYGESSKIQKSSKVQFNPGILICNPGPRQHPPATRPGASSRPRSGRGGGSAGPALRRGAATSSRRRPPALQKRMRVEFKFRTYLNCRSYTVPWTFELTACLSIASKPLLKVLHFGKIPKILVKI